MFIDLYIFAFILRRKRMSGQIYTRDGERQYYPALIDSKRTQWNIVMQRKIVKKMVHFLEWSQVIPADLLQLIASFCFNSPIVFLTPVYIPLRQPWFHCSKHCYFIYNEKNKIGLKLEILGSWQGKEGPQNYLMNLADYFCHFIPLESMELPENKQNSEKWKIVSKHIHFLTSQFRKLNQYYRKGNINKAILEAFSTVMRNNILLFKFKGIKFIYISHKDTHFPEVEAAEDLKFGFQLTQERWRMKLSNPDYLVHEESKKMKGRKEQKVFSREFNELKINDIYYEQ